MRLENPRSNMSLEGDMHEWGVAEIGNPYGAPGGAVEPELADAPARRTRPADILEPEPPPSLVAARPAVVRDLLRERAPDEPRIAAKPHSRGARRLSQSPPRDPRRRPDLAAQLGADACAPEGDIEPRFPHLIQQALRL